MSDLPDTDAHAPAPNDVSNTSFVQAMKDGIPHCSECNRPLCKKVNDAWVCHKCPVTMEGGK